MPRYIVIAGLLAVVGCSTPLWGAVDVDAEVARVVGGSGGRIVGERIGTSRDGRALHVLRIGAEGKPSLLIVAGVSAMHRVGVETALGVASRLAAEGGDVLDRYTVYVMPCADPDGLVRLAKQAPMRDGARTIAPVDDDRDGRVDEDPASDINGDGIVGIMRVYDPPAHLGIEATEIVDPENPRLTRKPDRMKGETANVALVMEGRDLDGDGLYDDVNGNGRMDFADVVLYFNQMSWIASHEPLSAFDFNGNGRVDFADVTILFAAI